MIQSLIEERVAELYEEFRIGELGFDLFHRAKKMGVEVTPYSAYIEMKNADLLWKYDQDAFSFYNPKRKCFQILFNDEPSRKTRMKFTIAHELGHIVLNHLLEEETGKNNRQKETEANNFAREFYMPQVILFRQNILSVPKLVKVFRISEDYAKVIIDRMKKRYYVTNGNIIFSNEEERIYAAFCRNEKERKMNYDSVDVGQ